MHAGEVHDAFALRHFLPPDNAIFLEENNGLVVLIEGVPTGTAEAIIRWMKEHSGGGVLSHPEADSPNQRDLLIYGTDEDFQILIREFRPDSGQAVEMVKTLVKKLDFHYHTVHYTMALKTGSLDWPGRIFP